MLARDFMTREVELCTAEDSVALALSIMEKVNCGFVPVVSDFQSKTLIGVVTDRDLALFLGRTNRLASDIQIKECYSRNPIFVTENECLEKVIELMVDFQIHRVPVITESRRVLGVISLKDLAEEVRSKKAVASSCLTDSEIGRIVESISRN
jgi:CBS domain-containing protein